MDAWEDVVSVNVGVSEARIHVFVSVFILIGGFHACVGRVFRESIWLCSRCVPCPVFTFCWTRFISPLLQIFALYQIRGELTKWSPSVFWFPSARPSILRGSKVTTSFFWTCDIKRRLNIASAVGASGENFEILSTCTVVCAEFVPWVFVLHFMLRDLHLASVHRVYRVRQRILTGYHYRTLSCFF